MPCFPKPALRRRRARGDRHHDTLAPPSITEGCTHVRHADRGACERRKGAVPADSAGPSMRARGRLPEAGSRPRRSAHADGSRDRGSTGLPRVRGVLLVAQVTTRSVSRRGLARAASVADTGRSHRTCAMLARTCVRGVLEGDDAGRESSDRRASALAAGAVEIRSESTSTRGSRGARLDASIEAAHPRAAGPGRRRPAAVPFALYNRLRDAGEESRPAPAVRRCRWWPRACRASR